jgi:murein DD-endopeptidase MepM/ murein hydrolase activator NlpD
MALLFLGVTFGPVVLRQVDAGEVAPDVLPSGVLTSATEYGQVMTTIQGKEVAEYRGGEVIEHEVKDGETVASIAELYNLQANTIIWLNNLDEKKPVIKPGQKLKILPIDGVLHTVKRGETIYSIAKRYGLDGAEAQGIVNYPFNTFVNDETFALAVGQDLVVPDGIRPKNDGLPPSSIARTLTPNAGAVSATGSFVWPTSGLITQGYRFYHRAIDIANRAGGNILAADSGKVVVAGWVDNSGYGNRVMIDHENGYVTLYAHLSLVQVQVGQTVKRGDVIGQMGSTGRSTGTHLHFEIRSGGVLLEPQSFLR